MLVSAEKAPVHMEANQALGEQVQLNSVENELHESHACIPLNSLTSAKLSTGAHAALEATILLFSGERCKKVR